MRNFCPPLRPAIRVAITLATAAAVCTGSTSRAQLPAVIDLGTTPGLESATVHRIYGGNPSDRIGPIDDSVTCFGDINGDGLADYVIGSAAVDTPAGINAGELYIVYGKKTAWAPTLDLGAGGAAIPNGTRIRGEATNDYLGFSAACGDINGDGLDDIVIGAPTNVSAPDGRNGRVYVIYGNPNLVGAVLDLTRICDLTPAITRIEGEAANDHFGYAVSCADVNGDGYDDILVGALGQIELLNSPGKGFVIFGGPTLPGQSLDLTQPVGTYGEVRILGERLGGRLGRSIAGGDLNGDGFDDIAIGTSIQTEVSPPTGSPTSSMAGPIWAAKFST